MKTTGLIFIISCLLLGTPSFAQDIVTFDDMGWDSNQSLDPSFTTGNTIFSGSKSFYTNYGCNFNVYGISIYFVFQDPAVDQFTVARLNNGSFKLNSIAAYQVSEASTDTLIIEGWNGSTKAYTSAFLNITAWQTLILNYVNINRVVFKLKSSGYPGLTDYNFDNFTFNDAPLPVELIEFKGAAQGSYITLTWQTSTELNNYGFDIERTP